MQHNGRIFRSEETVLYNLGPVQGSAAGAPSLPPVLTAPQVTTVSSQGFGATGSDPGPVSAVGEADCPQGQSSQLLPGL